MLPVSRCLPVLVAAAALVVAAPAWAQEPPPRAEPPAPRSAPPPGRDQDRSLSDAVRRVQRETGGRILAAERVPYDGRDINRVKYMDDRGRVRYMDDPAPRRSEPRAPHRPQPTRGDNR